MAKVWSKDAEREQLQKIAALIEETEPGSYIRMTFAGVPEICRRNIEDDFGDIPVQDLEEERNRHEKDNAEMGAKLLRLEHENQALQTHLDAAEDQIALLQRTADEWEKNANDAGEMYTELEEECRAKSQEITRLRAEIVRMKFERMTESDLATMYEKMEG